MITSGKYIGEIIDKLSLLEFLVENRGKIHCFDINRYIEDFFKEILNIMYGYKLINLNEERSNYPGIDLGDKANHIAFQITANKSGEKIKQTLQKVIDNNDTQNYNSINVLIIAQKQKSYTIDSSMLSQTNFNEEKNIIDIKDLGAEITKLDFEKLEAVYVLFEKQFRFVISALNLQEETEYTSETYPLFEKNIEPQIINFEKLKQYLLSNNWTEEEYQDEKFEIAIRSFIRALKEIPHESRVFFSFLLQHRDKSCDSDDYVCIDTRQVIRRYKGSEESFHDECEFLQDYNLIKVDQIGPYEYYVIKTLSYECRGSVLLFIQFLENKMINFDIPIVNLDFTCCAQ